MKAVKNKPKRPNNNGKNYVVAVCDEVLKKEAMNFILKDLSDTLWVDPSSLHDSVPDGAGAFRSQASGLSHIFTLSLR